MGSAIKQRTRPCCVNFGLWNDFVAFFFAEFQAHMGSVSLGLYIKAFRLSEIQQND